MGKKLYITLKQKVDIVDEAIQRKNIRETARKYNIWPRQIRYWKSLRVNYMETIKLNPSAKTINGGKKIKNKDVEDKILIWIQECINNNIYISSRQIIDRSLSINNNFHNGKIKSLRNWVYVFLIRNNLQLNEINGKVNKILNNKQKINDTLNKFNEKYKFCDTLNELMVLLNINYGDNEHDVIIKLDKLTKCINYIEI